MRVLVPLDGSDPSDLGRALVGNMAWPPQTTVRLISVVPDLFTMFGGPWMEIAPPSAPEIEEEVVERQRRMLGEAADRLARPGLAVETFVRRGRAATAIVREASEFGADLVVLGARGHGAWERALIGSVSAEVVDHAPCPVLVARSTTLERIMLAEDGSDGAAGARRVLAEWPPFAEVPVLVVSVASVPVPWQSGVSPLLMDAAFEAYEESLRETQERLAATARAAAEELAANGPTSTTEVRVGDPARELVAAATEARASLIVLGSRGLVGVRRLLLGSVARNVLHHAPCSVLIVRAAAAADAAGHESGATG